MMRAGLAVVVSLCLAAGEARGEPVALEGPADVQDVRIEDLTGDGIADLLLLQGRSVQVHPGRRGDGPEAEPRWRVAVPANVTFLDGWPFDDERGPTLLALGEDRLARIFLESGEVVPLQVLDARVAWTDSARAHFADLLRADGALYLPLASGWGVWPPPGSKDDPVHVAASAFREVRPPGAFLENVGAVTDGHPPIWRGAPPVGAPPATPPAVWVLDGRTVLAAVGSHRVAYDASFLPSHGEQHLEDLDGDGTPELVHVHAGNLESRVVVFRVPPLGWGDDAPRRGAGELRPAAAVLRLAGYVLEPAFVDLDADGRLDFVATTIAVDARNTIRALGGAVTARTKAFLNRGGEGRMFEAVADADVASDVSVKIRFTQTGTIEVRRSFTILPGGDLDGDGRRDLAIRTGKEAFRVHRGVAEGVWSSKGSLLKVPPIGDSPDVQGWTGDLDGDGRDELVLVYRSPPGGRDRLYLVGR